MIPGIGIPIFGIVIGILMIILSIAGCIGSWFKTKKILLYFMIGCGILALLNIIGVIWSIVEKEYGGMVLDIIALLFYGGCIFFAFSISRNSKWFSVPDVPI